MTKNEKIEYQFTATNSQLKKVVKDNISMLEKYGEQVLKVASKDKNVSSDAYEKLSNKIKDATNASSQYEKVFVRMSHATQQAIQRTVKTQAQAAEEAKRIAERQMREAERREKVLARFRKNQAEALEQTQNRNNADSRGVINTDAPTRSAKESADVFNQFFENEATKLGGAFSNIASFFGKTQGSISAAASSAAAFGAKLTVVVAIAQLVYKVVKKIATVLIKITSIVTKFVISPLKLLQTGFSALRRSIAGSNSGLQAFANLLGIGTGAGVGYMLSEAAKNASDMIEASNLFNVVMKDNVDEGNRWISTLSEMSGMDITGLKTITGLFYEMGAAVEMPSESATKLSQSLTELSLDISSLFNVDLETVTSNLTSGIRGMSRAVVKYGMDIRASTVEAFARTEFGITEQYETMNETNRVILRYLVMLKQASDSNGDFARTIEQPANQLRVFKQQLIGLSREFGRFIVDVLRPALPVINGIAMALRSITKFLADLFGVWSGEDTPAIADSAEDMSTGIFGIGDSASAATKSLKKFIAPFDELNVISDNLKNSGSGSGAAGYGIADPRLLQALDEAETKFGKVEMAAHKVRDAVLEFFGFEYVFDPAGKIDEYIRMIPGEFADSLATAFEQQDFETVGKLIAEKLNPLLESLAYKFSWENIGPSIRRNIDALTSALNSFLGTLDWNTVGQIFGNLLKTAFETFNYFTLSFDWTGLGVAIADSLNGFFQGFDISIVGTTLANVLNKIAEFASSFAKTFSWVSFGQQLSTSINNFFSTWNATKFGKAANAIITKLLRMLNIAIATTNWELVGNKIADFLEALNWREIMHLLGQTIWSALKAAVKTAVLGTKPLAPAYSGLGASYAGTVTGLMPMGYIPENVYSPADKSLSASLKPMSVTPIGLSAYVGRPFATGGVVTGPTRALIGEAGRAEMVMPLDNSPQMQQFVNQIADAVKSNGSQPTEVHVYIDSRAVASTVYDELRNVEFRRGTSLIR